MRAEVSGLAPLPRSRAVDDELAVLGRQEIADRWVGEAVRLAGAGWVAPDTVLADWMGETRCTVFEGAHGLLLDQDRGFHPFTTWARCGFEPALEILGEAAPDAEVERIGVMRCLAVRHGPGPLPTETAELAGAISEHNRFGVWQGEVRYGWFDAVLARYAIEVAGPLETLAVTHLDAPGRLGRWRLCGGYRLPGPAPGGAGDLVAARNDDGLVTRLAVPAPPDLGHQERLTAALASVRPELEDCPPEPRAVVERIERLLGRRVDLVSSGPRATDVELWLR
jgi:adenylosuccinate synthase